MDFLLLVFCGGGGIRDAALFSLADRLHGDPRENVQTERNKMGAGEFERLHAAFVTGRAVN